jgi:DeoR/GlpR family transcriptional regulator of sugar metabolism
MGVTDSNENDSEIKKAFFAAANKKILAVDSTKFDKASFVKVCGINDIDVIVTDKNPGEVWKEKIASLGATLKYEADC